MQELNTAIRLREEGKDEEARELLLQLHRSYPDDPQVNYQCAWIHDKLGLEKEAIPFYEKALEGLAGDQLRGAMLGLGSTYRCVGEYEKSAELLRQGLARFPERREFAAFLAMALYNLGQHREAMRLLLKALAETSENEGIARYKKALLFYADNLDETW